MRALINETEKMLAKLKDRLETCMMNNQEICISVECMFTNLLNTIRVDSYRVDKESIHLSYEDFEQNIILTDRMSITYDDMEDSFKFTYDKANIALCFI